MFFVSETGAIAAVALVFAEYANAAWEIGTGERYSHVTEVVVALAVIWLLTSVNLFGVYLSGLVQNFFGLLKVIALGAVIAASMALFSIAGTHDYLAWNRIRWDLGNELLAQGVDPLHISAGFEFGGWHNFDKYQPPSRLVDKQDPCQTKHSNQILSILPELTV